MKALILLLVTVAIANAETFRRWPALSATGQTEATLVVPAASDHTVQLNVSGSPTSCSAVLQGSLDGSAWFDLSAAQTCTTSVMFHVNGKPVNRVRINLTALSGGSSPSVVPLYLGK